MADRTKLLESLRRHKKGKRAADLAELYTSFGFEPCEGGKHLLYSHPDHRDLVGAVTRSSKELLPGYVQTAVKLIDELLKRTKEAENESDGS